ncbi:MAG: ABC transporter ATP-binding protein [Muribaculaceae bacterium]|nr:ABC transporter ATP-binding protein [Muribaculaceae bacterium]
MMRKNEPAIAVAELTKRFGSFTAVDRITFEVERGEIFGFLGANGAGKTTAMRMLCGLSRPTSGKGFVAGCDICRDEERVKSRIGYMSQRFSLYTALTVEENLRLFAAVYGLDRHEFRKRADALYGELEMAGLRDARVGSLPVGWKQKLAFAASTIHRPEVLFLDEPTGGVDPAVRRKFWELIYRASAEGMTVFVTTHYLDEAEYCDRVSIMVDGRIKALDTPSMLKRMYNAETMDDVFRIVAKGAQRPD